MIALSKPPKGKPLIHERIIDLITQGWLGRIPQGNIVLTCGLGSNFGRAFTAMCGKAISPQPAHNMAYKPVMVFSRRRF